MCSSSFWGHLALESPIPMHPSQRQLFSDLLAYSVVGLWDPQWFKVKVQRTSSMLDA